MRTLAEMENLRKRTEREVTDARLYGVASFARDCWPSPTICAARSMPCRRSCARARQPACKALIDGVELTERELLKALEKNGVRQFTPQGEKFDPNLHQAMFEVPDASVPAGSVVQVVQPGYMIGERVLRPALVGVSKGGPKVAPGSAAGNDNSRSRRRFLNFIPNDSLNSFSLDAVADRAQARQRIRPLVGADMPIICR